MKMNDMVIVSVDDHVVEPPTMFDKHLTGDALATAPKFRTSQDGINFWDYQGLKRYNIGLNAVVGRVPEEYGAEPTALSQLRKGTYDVHARIDDMNVAGIAASLNFASFVGFDCSLFHAAPDKAKSLVHLRAYNDWHIDEWCGAYPGRFIPCVMLPTWDMDATAAEIKRLAAKGCHTVSISENPTKLGLPSIHTSYWEPMWKAIADNDMTICLHIGAGNPAPHASMDTPIGAWLTTVQMAISTGAADWLFLEALERYPTMRLALSEGSIGWVPYFLERADFANERHKAWTHSRFQNRKPSDTFKEHFLTCFIDDAFGLQNLQYIGEDMVAYEMDYPHSDCVWPDVAGRLYDSVKHLTDAQIDKVTHRNAMRFFRFDPFKHHNREALTVGSLQAKAKAANIDITLRSYGGAKPLAPGEKPRVITSGDMINMFNKVSRIQPSQAAE